MAPALVPAEAVTDEGARPRPNVVGVGVLAFGHAINDGYSFVLQALLPALLPALGLTLGMAGGLVSFYQLISSLAQPVIGHLADRNAARWPAWAGVGLSGMGAGLLGLAPSYETLVGLLLVAGLGTAIFHPVSAAMVATAAPPRERGRWLSLYISAGNFGLALGPLAVGFLLDAVGPRGTWPILLPALVVAAVVMVFAPARQAPTRVMPSLRQTLRTYRRVLSALVAVVTLRAWSNVALVTFLPLLARERGMSLGDSAQILTAYFVSGATGGVLGGLVADRFGRDRVLAISLVASVPFGLYLAIAGEADSLFVAAAMLNGFFLNGSFVVLAIRGQESVPGSVGMVTGLILGLSVGIGGLAVTPLALLSEQVGLAVGSAVAACLALASALAMRWLPPAGTRR